jgi:hypothetical protein
LKDEIVGVKGRRVVRRSMIGWIRRRERVGEVVSVIIKGVEKMREEKSKLK